MQIKQISNKNFYKKEKIGLFGLHLWMTVHPQRNQDPNLITAGTCRGHGWVLFTSQDFLILSPYRTQNQKPRDNVTDTGLVFPQSIRK